MALQQAGQKTVVHKNEMFKAGWADVLEMLFDEALTHWDEEMWIRIDGEKPDWKFVNPNDFRNVPRLIPNELHGVVDGEDSIKQLTDDDGVAMTRDAMFDFQLNMGNGFPNDKAFMLQMLTDFAKLSFPDGPAITRAEMRKFLKEQVGMDIEDEPQQPPEMGMPPGSPPGMPMPQGMPQAPMPAPAPMEQAPPPQGPPPEIPPEVLALLQGGVA
jgi:hypothetical protein